MHKSTIPKTYALLACLALFGCTSESTSTNTANGSGDTGVKDLPDLATQDQSTSPKDMNRVNSTDASVSKDSSVALDLSTLPDSSTSQDLASDKDTSEPPLIEGAELKAFPSAVGFGRYVTGGRGGEVRRVTTLDDSGPGSLREAWEKPGKAYIVFDVAGYIINTSGIEPSDEKTILGQSAFRAGGHGITIRGSGNYGNPLVFGGFGQQAMRYMRMRRGAGVQGECCGDNFEPYKGVGNNIIDHSSFSWSTDENISFSESSTYTVQYSIISEGLMFSTHSYNTPGNNQYPSPHSMGSLNAYAQTEMSWYGNYFAHNNQRNPLFSQLNLPLTEIEFVNNIGYNWGNFGNVYARANDTTMNVNIINNLVKKGENSSRIRHFFSLPTNSTNANHRFFVKGNITDKRPNAIDPEWQAMGDWTANDPANTNYQADVPFDLHLSKVGTTTADKLPDTLFPHVGASLYRDAVDQRVVDDFRNNTGKLIDSPEDVGGYPALNPLDTTQLQDADKDGMDDAWEKTHGITSPNEIKEIYTINGKRWKNPGYEAIEVHYFTPLDLKELGLD